MLVAQRHQQLHRTSQVRAIAQQEKQQVQHDAQANQYAGRILANIDRLAGNKLATFKRARRQLFLDTEHVGQPKLLQQVMH